MGDRDELDYGPVTARYYDAAYATLESLGADVGFYRELAHRAAGPVLELGCGTGRVLGPIAADGVACTGIDASPEMLDVLRGYARTCARSTSASGASH
jgi:SAM-dependent methyltransferase